MIFSRTAASVAGKVIAVTGGARGIGAAIAADLAGRGAIVALGDIDAEGAKRTAAGLPGGAIGLPLDVTSTESYRSFLAEIERQLGPLDVLVGNAGVMWVGPFELEPEEAQRRQFDVNVHGVINGIKLAAPAMRTRGHGQIITVASAASKLTPRGEAAYAATKHAVYGYCCAVQAELHRSRVRISIVMPTVVETELAAGTAHGLIRRLTPDDVAAGVWTAISTRRRDVFVPAPIGWLTTLLAVLPERIAVPLGRIVVPNQLKQANAARRRSYQESL